MIARLTGRLGGAGADWVIIDVGGVGYQAFCSGRTISRLTAAAESDGIVSVQVETQIRDDRIVLHGFADAAEREWYRLLLTVQGVGPRVALAILTVLSPDQILQALAAQDRVALSRADGVGPKLAGRIVSELKDRAGAMALGPAASGGASGNLAGGGAGSTVGAASGALADATSALINLGYGRSEALSAASAARRALGESADVSALIRQALKELAR
ncbi:Holliday junction ATP-dependent DNA helicase RuvA [Azospirillaceae bacterium]